MFERAQDYITTAWLIMLTLAWVWHLGSDRHDFREIKRLLEEIKESLGDKTA